jgi:hypothetical protein
MTVYPDVPNPTEGHRVVVKETGEEFVWKRGRWRPVHPDTGWDVPSLVASVIAGVLGITLPALSWSLGAAAVAVALVLLLVADQKHRVPRNQMILCMVLIGVGALGVYFGYQTMEDVRRRLGG